MDGATVHPLPNPEASGAPTGTLKPLPKLVQPRALKRQSSGSGASLWLPSGDDVNVSVKVFHTLLVKQLKEEDEGKRAQIVGTMIQRCVVPRAELAAQLDGDTASADRIIAKMKDDKEAEEMGEYLQFGYRFNDELVKDLKPRKVRSVQTEAPIGGTSTGATDTEEVHVATYSHQIPLDITTVFEWWPYRVYSAKMKLELTSFSVSDPGLGTAGRTITFRPDLHFETKQKPWEEFPGTGPSSLVAIKNETKETKRKNVSFSDLNEKLDRLQKYDLVAPVPTVWGEKQTKKIKGGDPFTYSPILHLVFYLHEPVVSTAFSFLAPILLILLMMLMTAWERFYQNIGAGDYLEIMGGLVLTLVLLLPQLRTDSRSATKMQATDWMLVTLIAGMCICSVSGFFRDGGQRTVPEDAGVRFTGDMISMCIGVAISFGSMLIPLSGVGHKFQLFSKHQRSANENRAMILEKGKGKAAGDNCPHPNDMTRFMDQCWGIPPDVDEKGRRTTGRGCFCC